MTLTFDEVLSQVQDLLQREKRVSYRGLKRRFALDDDYLEDLKEELIGAKGLAADEDGRFLVWLEDEEPVAAPSCIPSHQSYVPAAQSRFPEAERRQLTVEFIDLVGSTTLSAQLDPEEYRDLVRAYQQASAAVIERFDGHIAQYLGDGLLAYFGYPVAHEDDAARALRAGLRIVEALRTLNPRLSRPLQVRIGIHTGPVVVGEMGGGRRQEQLALGETPNLAARIQGQAAPDEVVVSAATHHLVEGLFAFEDRGRPELKGVSAPFTLYRVVKEEEAQNRFQVVARKGLTQLVGRDREYGLLRERWQRVKDGAGQVVLLSGEPGIGKSRLVEALKETVEYEGSRCLELHCSPYAQNSALQPVIEHLQRTLHFRADDTSEEQLRKLALGAHSCADAMPLLAALLSLPHPDGYPALTLSPQKQKEKTHEALVSWLCGQATRPAVMYAWEDLHWADPSTLELLTLFLNQVPTKRLLAMLTFRPEFTPPWGSHSYVSQLALRRLGRSQVETMVNKVTGDRALPREFVQQIVTKTDGVPLFVEELTKTVMEQGVGAQHAATLQFGIPATLQDALMARLDRLGTAKEIAQVGATIGREFDYALLHAVSPLNQGMLQQGLRLLVETELVFQNGVPPRATYLFKHALIQDAAYQSLLKSTRQRYHKRIVQVLDERFAGIRETQPELLAHHYTEAGLIEQAIPYWHQAGQRANQHGANAEAVSHLSFGLELLQTLSDTPARAQQELSLRLALGALLTATKGFASPEVEHAYRRAGELCGQAGDKRQVFRALSGLTLYHSMRLEHQTARELADQMLGIAQEAQDSDLLIQAHRMQGSTRLWIGEFQAARSHLELGIALYDPERHHALALSYGQDPGVACRLLAHQVLWILGYPDQALTRAREALALAQGFSHVNTLGYGLACLPAIHYLRGEWQAAEERAEACVAFATEAGLPYFVAQITIFWGAALAAQGRFEEGITKMRQGLAAQRATGGQGLQQLWLALQVEAYIKTEQFKEGWIALEEALTIRPKYGERYWEAELYRLKGELTLQQFKVRGSRFEVGNPQADAAGCFQQAIETARELSAKSWELRAATSLARLWQQQSRKKEAHQMLSEIYNWFTEGFDTKDLKDAKALLEELS
jgi:predicted ATPase/class 3 adenylate cyclase